MIESQSLHLKNYIARLIHGCKNIRPIKQIHSQITVSPILSADDRSFLVSRLIFYLCTASESPASLKYATRIFNLFEKPSLYVYNALIRANATKAEEPASCECLALYKEMMGGGLAPDCITLPFLLKECSKRSDGPTGRAVHVHVVKFGYESDVYVQNALISLYSECGVLEDARKVFDEMSNRDVVSWNSMIVGSLRNGMTDSALELFMQMKERKNIITWNSVITGLVQGGWAKEALDIFHEMQNSGDKKNAVRPDKITLASAISACASLGAIDHGKWVHSYLERSGIESDMVIGTALVDMYGKCGYVKKAFEVFNGMRFKDVLAWTAMISVLALNGYGNEAFKVFEEMEAVGMKPNAVTFVGLLSASAHSGLVEKGRQSFDKMKRDYHVEPQVEHYACMVDLLGRAGLFTEAEDLIHSMPMKPDVFVWGALLGACQMHGNVALGEKVAKFLIDLEPQNHVFYIILCDLYAKAGRFDDQKRVRSLMKGLKVRKTVPGSSMIEIDGVVYEFSVKGSLEIPITALESVLLLLSCEMKREVRTHLPCLVQSEVYTSDPSNVEHFLKTNFPNYGKGKYNRDIMEDLFGEGIFAVDGKKWRHQRKLASYEFSARVLREFSCSVFRSNAAKLASKVYMEALASREMDLQDLFMKSAMDAMFKVGFGVGLDSLSGSDETSNRFIKAFDDSNVIVYWRYVDVFWKVKRFLNVGLERNLKENIKIIDNFVYSLIHHKREQMMRNEEGEREDILSRFLIESEKDSKNIMTDKYLRDIILSFLIAGKDTSANTLAWFFYMLCKNPLIQEKVFQEVKIATGVEDQLSVDEFVVVLSEAALDKMQYLHAALTETLRLYPAVPVDGKCAEADDILPDGYEIKKGDGINYMPYAMGRMPYIWGDDAEEFRPERWLENGTFRSESPFKFTAFQGGPRICLGKEFAYRQMKIIAATLVLFFRFKLVDESRNATYRTMFTLHMDTGLPLYAFARLN